MINCPKGGFSLIGIASPRFCAWTASAKSWLICRRSHTCLCFCIPFLFFKLMWHCSKQRQWCKTRSNTIPCANSSNFGNSCKQFESSSATRWVNVCFARSTPCWSEAAPRINYSILNLGKQETWQEVGMGGALWHLAGEAVYGRETCMQV